MHRFTNPSDYERHKRWIQAIKNKELGALPAEIVYNYHLVCHNHFEPSPWSSHYAGNGLAEGNDDTEENVFMEMLSVEHAQSGPSTSNVAVQRTTSAMTADLQVNEDLALPKKSEECTLDLTRSKKATS
ncbi:hypothetical protein Trydic_g2003 [Trypoxylus dichotomus]